MRTVAREYDWLASTYDWIFGATLKAGRVAAIRRLPIKHGDEILEVGIGTGLSAALYPGHCAVTGIDVSRPMLDRAARRVAERGLRNVRLLQMDAADLQFPDESFSIIYAGYVMTAVRDPVRVAREMRRVCRPDGCIALLNHFRSRGRLLSFGERLLSPLALHAGFRTDLDLWALLAEAGLSPVSICPVNRPGIWSLVICGKGEPEATTAAAAAGAASGRP